MKARLADVLWAATAIAAYALIGALLAWRG